MMFDEWIVSVFDHPLTSPEWHWDLADSFWDGPPATVVDYMTQLFTEAETALDPFSDAQATQGLYAVISNSLTDYPLMLTNPSVPVRARLDCIEAWRFCFGGISLTDARPTCRIWTRRRRERRPMSARSMECVTCGGTCCPCMACPGTGPNSRTDRNLIEPFSQPSGISWRLTRSPARKAQFSVC